MIRIASILDTKKIILVETASLMHRTWTFEMFQSAITDPLCTFYVFEMQEQLVGFGCMKNTGMESEIEYIAVSDGFRRRGIGQILLTALLNEANRARVKTVFLEVGTQNMPAIALYQKNGFNPVSVRKNYYGEGKDATILKKNLM